MPLANDVCAVVVDIEGTTTPISFVYDVLFPFAKVRLAETCARAGENAAIAESVRTLEAEYQAEKAGGAEGLPAFEDGAPYAAYLMEQDRKSTGLKMLQGLIWEQGYDSGELKSVVYPDVIEALRRWKDQGIRVRVYSSGSVLAQKLLFGHTPEGDLIAYFDGFHDTTTGAKRESVAYARIAEAMGLLASQILFLSDVVEELDAARVAGMQTTLVMRPGNRPVSAPDHPVIHSFEELN